MKIDIKYKEVKEVAGKWNYFVPTYSVRINGIPQRRNKNLVGCRDKYFLKKYGIIIKVGDHEQTEKELAVYKKIRPEHRKYFPKLIRGSKKKGYTIQRIMDFDDCPRNPSAATVKLVHKLIKIYKLIDISANIVGNNWNWGICRVSGNPILYDLGM